MQHFGSQQVENMAAGVILSIRALRGWQWMVGVRACGVAIFLAGANQADEFLCFGPGCGGRVS